MDRSDLYTSRMVVRFFNQGQAYLGSYLRPASLPLSGAIDGIVKALWDRGDRRATSERLAGAPGVPRDPEHREFVLSKLIESGLVVEREVNEIGEWVAQLESRMQPIPRVDQVELTNACPFTCGFCPRGIDKMERPVGHLDLGLLREIVDQVKDIPNRHRKSFGLHYFGEPLLHPDVPGAVRIVREAGLEPEISVNPILLTPEKGRAILEAGVGVFILSMDGLDTETLVRARGKHAGPFERAAAHVEAVIEAASKMARPPNVMVSMVGTIHNRHQWRELFTRYRRLGLPWLTPVVRLMDDFGDPDIVQIGVKQEQRHMRQLCGSPYGSVSVLWDGTVVPCCHDFDGHISLGNLRTQTLAEVWSGELYRRFRERWKEGRFEPDEPCHSCRWRPDLFIAQPGIADRDAWTPALWPEERGTTALALAT
jgi:radical SAM protein with 4Fe4S-binding SPASM domain